MGRDEWVVRHHWGRPPDEMRLQLAGESAEQRDEQRHAGRARIVSVQVQMAGKVAATIEYL